MKLMEKVGEPSNQKIRGPAKHNSRYQTSGWQLPQTLRKAILISVWYAKTYGHPHPVGSSFSDTVSSGVLMSLTPILAPSTLVTYPPTPPPPPPPPPLRGPPPALQAPEYLGHPLQADSGVLQCHELLGAPRSAGLLSLLSHSVGLWTLGFAECPGIWCGEEIYQKKVVGLYKAEVEERLWF